MEAQIIENTSEDEGFSLHKSLLRKASQRCPHGIIRLAKYLRLNVNDMAPDETVKFIYWRMNNVGLTK